jgi:anaerobic selenocysteine-containing dehydrogenase
VPFADRRFATASGRVELVSELPAPLIPAPAPGAPAGALGALRLLATKSLHMVNSQIQPERLPAEPLARLHPDTLAARGLGDGAAGVLTSPVGRLAVRLVADATVRRDVVQLNPARWQGDLVGVNQLRSACLTDAGEGAAMHETLVTVAAG